MNITCDEISDDVDLLKLMMADQKVADSLYRPTQYWSYYERKILPELLTIGLKDIHNRPNSKLRVFLGHQTLPHMVNIELNLIRLISNKFTRTIPGWQTFLNVLSKLIGKSLDTLPVSLAYNVTVKDIQLLSFYFAEALGRERGARPLRNIEMSIASNPADIFVVDGKKYNYKFLQHYIQYTYIAQSIDFNDVNVIVELGSGFGSQAEVFKKVNRNVSLLLFDIVPQLYVAEQYLKATFPKDIVSYRETRELSSLHDIESGKIYILGSWQTPMLRKFKYDLFVNSRSFAEMEPDVVRNYLSIVSNGARAVYIMSQIGGMRLSRGKNDLGVLERVNWSDYEKELSQKFNMISKKPFFLPAQPSMRKQHGNDMRGAVLNDALWIRKTD